MSFGERSENIEKGRLISTHLSDHMSPVRMSEMLERLGDFEKCQVISRRVEGYRETWGDSWKSAVFSREDSAIYNNVDSLRNPSVISRDWGFSADSVSVLGRTPPILEKCHLLSIPDRFRICVSSIDIRSAFGSKTSLAKRPRLSRRGVSSPETSGALGIPGSIINCPINPRIDLDDRENMRKTGT
jgi:hypothetical protein